MVSSFDMGSLSGVVPILPTPLSRDGELDADALGALVDFCATQGMDGALVLGSNGEFPYLLFEEQVRVMEIAVEAAAGRIPIIGTASAFGTREAVDLARAARAAGCSAVLAALPLYFDVTRSEAVGHFEALARDGGMPVYYYHFAEVTGLRLRPPDLAELAAIDGVVGAKITVASKRFLRATVEATRAHDWRVFTGTSFLLHECISYGGAGVFCPLPLVAPREVREVYDTFHRGNVPQSRWRYAPNQDETKCRLTEAPNQFSKQSAALQRRLRRAVPIFSGLSAPARVQALGFSLLSTLSRNGTTRRIGPPHGLLKETLRMYGHALEPTVREPFGPITEEQRRVLRKVLDDFGWKLAAASHAVRAA